MGSARPSVTKRQRELLKRERQATKAAKRAARKIASHEEGHSDSDIEEQEPVSDQKQQEQSET